MLQLDLADFAHAIVGIGSDLASSLMTVMVLTELGIKNIWVKAMTPEHGQIAQRVGAHHVVCPEADMGARVERWCIAAAEIWSYEAHPSRKRT
jgi:trk system potassium uptake protein TrkA